jgi:uncharacterized protein YkwD
MHRLSIVLTIGALVFLGVQPAKPDTLMAGVYVAASEALAEEPAPEAVTVVEDEIAKDAPVASTLEVALFNLANADRVRYGLAPVDVDPSLLEIARARAAAQLTLERLSHYDATGRVAFASLLDQTGVGYRLAGENLARWGTSDYSGPDRIQQAWMGSPTHRANILEPTFDRLAVGAATNDSGRVAFAQIFRDAP